MTMRRSPPRLCDSLHRQAGRLALAAALPLAALGWLPAAQAGGQPRPDRLDKNWPGTEQPDAAESGQTWPGEIWPRESGPLPEPTELAQIDTALPQALPPDPARPGTLLPDPLRSGNGPPQAAPPNASALDPAQLPADAQTAFTYGPAAGGFAIVLPGASEASVTQDGRDLLISLGRALPPFDAQDLQARAAGWIEGVNVGFDALLLRLAPDVAARAAPRGAALTIELARAPAAQAVDTVSGAEDATGARRLALLDAQLLARTGRLGPARLRFEALRAASPDSAEPVTGLAGIEQQTGRWRRGLELYRQAQALDPDNRSLRAAIDSIERSQAPRARLDADHRRVRGGQFTSRAELSLVQASGHMRLSEAWRLGAVVDAADIRAGQVLRASAAAGSFSGRRERAELYAQHDARDGTVLAGSLFGGSGGNLGAGAQARVPDDTGLTLARVEYRRPSWDYVEGLIDNATRDRVALGRVQRLGARLTGRLEAGLNRYAVPDQSDVARTTSLSGELRLGALAGIAGLSAAYGIEAEYVGRRAALRAGSGEVFRSNWVLDREVHTATLGLSRSRGDRWAPGGSAITFDGYGGFGADRFGRSGPLAAVAVGYAQGPVEMQLRASYVRNIGRARTTAATIGGYVSILF